MEKIYKITFWTTLATSLILIISSFVLPPTGIIDPSVLGATGELLGFVVIAQIPYLLKKGHSVKTKIGEKIEIEVEDTDKLA